MLNTPNCIPYNSELENDYFLTRYIILLLVKMMSYLGMFDIICDIILSDIS